MSVNECGQPTPHLCLVLEAEPDGQLKVELDGGALELAPVGKCGGQVLTGCGCFREPHKTVTPLDCHTPL